MNYRFQLLAIVAITALVIAGCGTTSHKNSFEKTMLSKSPDPAFVTTELLHAEPFNSSSNLHIELENGGDVSANDGILTIDVPAGCTVWFKPLLEGSILIEYEARLVVAGGKNDRLSDLNCFWMSRDARGPEALEDYRRSGQFADYNPLRGYYVGLGGNNNTTTRFRRYIGDKELRPLLPQHDLQDAANLLKPNVWQRIRLIAAGPTIQYWRDDRKMFDFHDPDPYTSGWFGFRTVTSHQEIRVLRIYRLEKR